METGVVFNKTNGNLATRLTSEDHISGLLFFGEAAPTEFDGANYKQFFSVKEAEAAGITDEANNAYRLVHYHIAEYFRVNPQSTLWVGLLDTPTTVENPILDFQNFTDGQLRQLGIMYPPATLITDLVSIVQGLHAQALLCYKEYMPLHVVYAPHLPTNLVVSSLPNLRTGTSYYCSVLISQDGAGVGNALFADLNHSVTAIGACLGAISLAKVHESIGWVGKFNMASTELDVPALSNGKKMKELFVTDAAYEALNNKGYIFLRKLRGISGTYFNGSHTAVALTNDFNSIERNRTIDKAIRGVRAFLLPEFNRPLYVDAAGNLRPDILGYLESKGKAFLEQMFNEGEISNFGLLIDPTRNVIDTNEVIVNIAIQPVKANHFMLINIGFTSTITTQ